MAITVTDRGVVSGGPVATLASASFTPANGSLIIAWGYMWDTNNSGSRMTFTDAFADTGGGAWTAICQNDTQFPSSAWISFRAYYRRIGTTPGAHTVTGHGNAGAPDNIEFSVVEVGSAYSAPVPTGQAIIVANATGTITCTLPQTPNSSSAALTGCFQTAGAAPGLPAGYTSVAAVGGTGDGMRLAYKIGSTAAATAYTGLQTTYPNLGIAFEIAMVPSTAIPGFSLSDTFGDTGGTTWAKAVEVNGDGAEINIWYRRVGTGAVSGHVHSDAANSSPGREMSTLEVKNRNTSVPLRPGQTVTASVTTAGETMQLPSVPNSDSVVVAGTISRGDASAPGTPAAHTSVVNVSTGGDGYQTSYEQLNALQSVAYTGLATTRNLGAMAEFQTQTAPPPPPPGGTTGFRLFADTSPWNTVKIPGVTYPWYTACDSTLANLNYGINNGPNYYTPVAISQPSDPMTHFSIGPGWNNSSSWTYDGPVATGVIAPAGGDGNIDFVFPNGDILDLYQESGSGTSRSAAMGVLHNWRTGSGWGTQPYGPAAGTTAVGCSQGGGSILAADIATGHINHALRIAFDYANLGGAGGPGAQVGLAIHNDDGGGPGPLSEGMFLMVDGAEPAGLPYWGHELWVTLATYGAYITDRLDGQPMIFGDGSAEQTAQFGYYSQMPWINTVCKRLRATHFGW